MCSDTKCGFVGLVVLLGLAVGFGAESVQVPDPSINLALVPKAASAGVPPIIRPGTRLTFYGMSASVPGEYSQLVQDENGQWVDKNTGRKYGEADIPSASGAGYNVVHVGYVGNGLVQLSTKLYTLDSNTNRCMYSGGSGLVAHAGCASDYWIHPDALKQVQEVNSNGVRIIRMPYTVNGKTYKAIRFQREDAKSYTAQVYDLETGLLIYHGSRTQGAPVLTPPVGGMGQAGVGQGSTQLTSGWIVEVTDIDIPWKNAKPPQWVDQFSLLSYRGIQRTIVVGTQNDRPMEIQIRPKARGKGWLRFASQGVIQSIAGMPPEQTGQEGACGMATIGGFWISPETLGNLSTGKVIEKHSVLGTTTSVSQVGSGYVIVSEVGPQHRIDYAYNIQTGILAGMTLTQQLGLGTTIHSLELVGQN